MAFGGCWEQRRTFCFRLLHSVQEVEVLCRGRRASDELCIASVVDSGTNGRIERN